MPRTIWTHHPRDVSKSERELRDDAERSHWSQTRIYFQWEATAYPSEDTQKSRMNLGVNYSSIEVDLEELDNDAVRNSCFKDCALYATGRNFLWKTDLFSRIYRRWFPSRAEDTDIGHRAFFCQFFKIKTPDTTLSTTQMIEQIARYHNRLCDELDKKIPKLPQLKPSVPADISDAPVDRLLLSPDIVYQLRPTFRKCLLFMQGTNDLSHGDQRGSLGGQDAFVVALEPESMPSPTSGMDRITCEGLQHAAAFHCKSLECAIQYILSADPARADKRREWNGYYQEELDQNLSVDEMACQCWMCCG